MAALPPAGAGEGFRHGWMGEDFSKCLKYSDPAPPKCLVSHPFRNKKRKGWGTGRQE
jgi:hypothetical protein